MKTSKSKPQRKSSKKAVKKQIEQSLTEKFLAVVRTLGHDTEVIAGDIAKASKAAAKKLSKKLSEVKAVVEDKIDDITAPKSKTNKVKLGKKDASKLMKKVDKSVTKVVKKAVLKAKPVATSVKVTGISPTPHAESSAQPTIKKVSSNNKAMANKVTDAASSTKTAVVKAVSNNPVKKVPAKAIPTKTNTTDSGTKK